MLTPMPELARQIQETVARRTFMYRTPGATSTRFTT